MSVPPPDVAGAVLTRAALRIRKVIYASGDPRMVALNACTYDCAAKGSCR